MKSLITDESWNEIETGRPLVISGNLFTVRDGTLKKLFSDTSLQPDFLRRKVLYFCGPTPPPPGKVIGSCGPTTSSRMEPFFEQMGKAGVKALIGKGEISHQSYEILEKYKIQYFVTVGGIGALLASKVISSQVVCYEELGAEAIFQLEVKDFPVIRPEELRIEN